MPNELGRKTYREAHPLKPKKKAADKPKQKAADTKD